MKLSRKTIIPVIAFLSLSFTGCADFLDTTPHDSLNSDNALESLEDFNNTTNSVYESMRSSSYTANFMLMVPDVMSDNLILNRDGRLIYNEFAGFKFYADTYGVSGMWSAAYNAILGTNEVITRMESDPSIIASDEKLGKNLLAECLALRGMIHFDLVRLYGKNYLQASDSDLGVTYKKDTETTLPARNTVKEVYTWLTEDLERAKGMMSDDYNTTINYRLNKKAIAAILAKQIANWVVIYSPLQMAADMIENYEGHPAFQFFRDFDADCDWSEALAGEPGEFVVIVRKAKDKYFLGATTNEEARTTDIKLDFLEKGKTYKATIYADGANADWETNPTSYEILEKTVTTDDTLSIRMAKGGGQAITFIPLEK